MTRNIYFCFQLHTNLWYAEHTHEQAIRQFSSTFEDALDIFEKHRASACWDWETSISLDLIDSASPEFFKRLNNLIEAGLHEVIPCTWGNTLATHHTLAEFHRNFELTQIKMKEFFVKVAPCWVSQDGAWSPQFVQLLKDKGMKYILLDRRLLNRHYKNKFTVTERYQTKLIDGLFATNIKDAKSKKKDALPFLTFGLEGTNSYSDMASVMLSRIEELPDSGDYFFYPFIDTERLNPKILDEWLTALDNIGVIYITPSKFLEKFPPNEQTPHFWFDVGDWHDWSFHNDIYADQKLWTAVEIAREKWREANWWMDLARTRLEDGMVENKVKTRIISAQTTLVEAFDEIMMAQSSDKSHWYACQHKLDIGQRYAVGAYEKVSKICGWLPCACKKALAFIPKRQHSIKYEKMAFSLINISENTIRKNFPICINFPYIVVVNLNTKATYNIDFPAQDSKKVSTIFNIIPRLDIHNHRTELFYQIPRTISANELIPMMAEPCQEELDYDENTDFLENECLKVILEEGNIKKIIHKASNFTFESSKDSFLFSPLFETHLTGGGGQKIILEDEDCDCANSIVIQQISNNGLLKLTTKYRIFKKFPALLVDSYAAIAGPIPGIFTPFHLEWKDDVSEMIHECLNHPIIVSDWFNEQLFINDWAILHSNQNGGCGIGVAFEKQISSAKMILHKSKHAWDFGFTRHFPEWVSQHLLNGLKFHRMWILPYVDENVDPDTIQLLKQLSNPPVVSWYL